MKYECMCVLHKDSDEAIFIDNLKKITNINFFNIEFIGLKKLAHSIAGEEFGKYVILKFEGSKAEETKLGNRLKYFNEVLKYIIIKEEV